MRSPALHVSRTSLALAQSKPAMTRVSGGAAAAATGDANASPPSAALLCGGAAAVAPTAPRVGCLAPEQPAATAHAKIASRNVITEKRGREDGRRRGATFGSSRERGRV